MITTERAFAYLPAASRWRLQSWFGRFRKILRDIRWRATVQSKLPASGEVRLHIGCGDIDAPGFVNIDARAARHIDFVTDRLDSVSFAPDGVAQLIYMSHVLEHLPHNNVGRCLRELRRVLKPGGVLRISVPDFDLMLAIYDSSGRDIDSIQEALMGGQDYRFNFHCAAFNRASLTKRLIAAGFSSVRPWNPVSVDHHDFADWASRKMKWQSREFEISLNIEAIK